MKYLIIVLTLCFNTIPAQCVCERYEKGIQYIKQDFKEKGIEKNFKDVLNPKAYGISIYEHSFPIYKSESYFTWLNIEKTKASEIDKCLSKLKKKYWEKYWKSSDYYETPNVFAKNKFKGPSHIAVFNELRNDSLRIDIISNSREGLKYCGSINKYLLIFDKKDNIIDAKNWTDHYECL